MNNVLLFISLFILAAAQFGGADAYNWVTLLLTPVTAIIGWFAGRRMRNNDAIQKMQETINLLASKNSELYAKIEEQNKRISQQTEKIAELTQELTLVRKENAELKDGQTRISKENAELKRIINSKK